MQALARPLLSPIRVVALAAAALLAGCGGGSDAPPPKAGEFVDSFGTHGIATFVSGPFESARASARFASVNPDSGTIRAAGNVLGSSVHAHLYPDGSPEAQFAGTGFQLLPAAPNALPFNTSRDGVAVFARPEGTEMLVESVHVPCVTGPQCAISGGGYDATAVRVVTSAGTTVPGYGPAGEGVLQFKPIQALAEPSGAVLVLGRAVAGPAGARRLGLERLTPQGMPDAAFAANAAAAIECPGIGTMYPAGAAMARRADGKLLLAQSYAVNGVMGDSRTCVCRLLPDGAIDPSFGDGGYAVLPWEFWWDEMSPVALFALPNGGSALFLQKRRELEGNFHYYYMIATMTADGALDASLFGRGIGGPTDLHVAKLTAVAMQADGRFLIAGYPALGDNLPASPGGPIERVDPSQPRIGRILPEGGADLSFGPLGTGYAPLLTFGTRLDPRHLHIGPDRSIFIAGSAGAAGPVNDREVTRFAVGKLAGDAAPAP